MLVRRIYNIFHTHTHTYKLYLAQTLFSFFLRHINCQTCVLFWTRTGPTVGGRASEAAPAVARGDMTDVDESAVDKKCRIQAN